MRRIVFFNLFAALPVTLLILMFVVPTFRGRYVQDRRDATRVAVESVFNIIVRYDKRASLGEMSVEAAQKGALADIEALRYGSGDYFWVNDLAPRMLMHPTNAALNGKMLTDYRDPNGKALFLEMVDVSKASGGGFVDYMWPKPGNSDPVPKTSYVQLFKPWGWVVGSGVYLDDVEANLAEFEMQLAAWFALCLVVSVAIAIFSGLHYGKTTLATVKQVALDLVKDSARLLSSSSQITKASHGLTDSTTQQSAAIEQAAASMEEMSSMIAQTTQLASGTQKAAESGRSEAAAGRAVVERMVAAMREISAANDRVQSLVKMIETIKAKTQVINDIAFETRLLAFNASIEAARAGALGRGFAVVAEEVGKLAVVSNRAASEVQALLDESAREAEIVAGETRERVDLGQKTSQECESAFSAMDRTLSTIADSIVGIATAAREQNTGVQQTTLATQALEKATQINVNSAQGLLSEATVLTETAQAVGESAKLLGIIVNPGEKKAEGAAKEPKAA